MYSEYTPPDRVADAEALLASLERNPDLMDIVDEATIKEAARIVLDKQQVREAERVAEAVRQGADIEDDIVKAAGETISAALWRVA